MRAGMFRARWAGTPPRSAPSRSSRPNVLHSALIRAPVPPTENVMPPVSNEFTVRETHGMLLRPGTEIQASSDGRAWTSLYASVQREVAFEDSFKAVDDPLIVLHLDGPVTVNCRVHKGENSCLIPPGGMVVMPNAMDFNVRLE